MIETNQLRIDNHVAYKNIVYEVSGVKDGAVKIYGVQYGTDDSWYPASEIDAMPLTDDLLLQFGFVEKGFVDQDQDDVEWMAAPGLLSLTWRNELICFDCFELPHIKHLHQLQNLYHALTGQELEMKKIES